MFLLKPISRTFRYSQKDEMEKRDSRFVTMHEHDEKNQSERWYLPRSRWMTKDLGRSWIKSLEGSRKSLKDSGLWESLEILRIFGSVKSFWWRRQVLFIRVFQARSQRLRLKLDDWSNDRDLIPILGGKVRMGTDASFNTEGTWTVHYSSVYHSP